jgi:adenylosuccinate synthase
MIDPSHVVIGLGFGDEGKGRVVSEICRDLMQESSDCRRDPVILRFSGGPQAAHHVVMEDGRDHVFSHFGSGSFWGAGTIWSQDCSINPYALVKEHSILRSKGVTPQIYIDPRCPVITPYDIVANLHDFTMLSHGTCGMGIFSTIQREREGFHLWAQDLQYPTVLRLKLEALRTRFFDGALPAQANDLSKKIQGMIDLFLGSCQIMCTLPGVFIKSTDVQFVDYTHFYLEGTPLICEGAQGLLLDQNYGFFPHCTPSNTGLTNLINRGLFDKRRSMPTLWLVTRAYQTRHGNGPMSKIVPNNIQDNPWEQNLATGPQGEFRRTLLDLELLRYAYNKDPNISKFSNINLVITCMDLVENEYRLLDGKDIICCESQRDFINKIAWSLPDIKKVFISDSPSSRLKEHG